MRTRLQKADPHEVLGPIFKMVNIFLYVQTFFLVDSLKLGPRLGVHPPPPIYSVCAHSEISLERLRVAFSAGFGSLDF